MKSRRMFRNVAGVVAMVIVVAVAAFAELMIPHHEGAVRMLTDLLTDGSDQFLAAMGGDMMTAQSVQIWQMEQMLAEMG